MIQINTTRGLSSEERLDLLDTTTKELKVMNVVEARQ